MNGNTVGVKTLAYLRGEKDLFQERERLAQARKQSQVSGLAFWLSNAQNRRTERFWKVASLLQENSRMSLTEISKQLKVPVSTLFDTLKELEKFFHFTIALKDGILPRDTMATQFQFAYQVSIEGNGEGETHDLTPSG
jgi:hypothetical protein